MSAARTVPKRKNSASSKLPPGFRSPPKSSRVPPIKAMSIRELHDLHRRNATVLAEPGTSDSSYYPRMTSEQQQIENRLIDLETVPQLDQSLRSKLTISPDTESNNAMDIGPSSPTQSGLATSRMIEAKRRALARPATDSGSMGTISMSEAMQLEQQAYLADKERKARLEEKRRQRGYPQPGEAMTRQEREARIWAFMNHKPTDSDLEDDSDYDPDEDDPATWFDDDQDDGVKGQDIVEPDTEDYADIIRVDQNYATAYNTFYEPRDGD